MPHSMNIISQSWGIEESSEAICDEGTANRQVKSAGRPEAANWDSSMNNSIRKYLVRYRRRGALMPSAYVLALSISQITRC